MTGTKNHNGKNTPSNGAADTLSHQYGGIHASRWVNLLPPSWTPYIQLSRIDPPAALFLIFFPHFYGILHTARHNGSRVIDVLRVCALLLGSIFFASNAAHAWNDIVDAPIDRQIARTKNRPIARGTISTKAALIFFLSQTLGTSAFLWFLPLNTTTAIAPAVLVAIYYPFAKRHTYFPQVVLGFCLAWGIVTGSAAMGLEQAWSDPAVLLLVLSSTMWTVIYDTVYAYQDITDDVKVGVKSTAVLFRGKTKSLLWCSLVLMVGSLIFYGRVAEMGIPYYICTVGGCLTSLGLMILNVELRNEASCWWWFSSGFWFTAMSIAIGLLAGYMVVLV